MSIVNIRERILVKVVTVIEALSSIKKVARDLPKGLEELESVPDTQIPYCTVTGELPRPEPHPQNRSKNIWADVFEGELHIFVGCYYKETGDYSLDQIKGDLYDDLWKVLNADQSLGGDVYYFEILPTVDEFIAEPYAVFRLTLVVKYKHGIGGT